MPTTGSAEASRGVTGQSTNARSSSRHVSLVALPDAVVSTLFGIFDVMNAFAPMGIPDAGAPVPFHADIVGETAGRIELASGVPIEIQRSIDTIDSSDIVIVP